MEDMEKIKGERPTTGEQQVIGEPGEPIDDVEIASADEDWSGDNVALADSDASWGEEALPDADPPWSEMAAVDAGMSWSDIVPGSEPDGSEQAVAPWLQDPSYLQAMELVSSGDGTAALDALRHLVEVYPEEKSIRDLLTRTELQSVVARAGQVPEAHRPPAPLLQSLLWILVVCMAVTVGIAGFVLAYTQLVIPSAEANRLASNIAQLEQQSQRRLDAGDWLGAETYLAELATLQPDNPRLRDALQYIEQERAVANLYVDAVEAQQQGDYEAALILFQGLEAQRPGYQDVARRIQAVQQMQALEAAWQQVETLLQSGDADAAVATLLDIRSRAPDFRRIEVEARLFQIKDSQARALIQEAGGNVEMLREALLALDAALTLQPTRQDLIRERNLAHLFVKGSEAADRQDWVGAVEYWQRAWTQRPDYQAGILNARLQKAYPQAARQLVARAAGATDLLSQAVDYFDQALANNPGDEAMRAERQMAAEYVEGAEAFAQGYWNQAIARWGPLFALQPAYQDGALQQKLEQACGASPGPDPAMCPP